MRIYDKHKIILISYSSVLLLGVCLLLFPRSAQADVYVTILAVNATEEVKDKEVKQYLPADLSKEDIIDAAGFEVAYDVNKAAYYVHGTIKLQPKESKAFRVRVRDIWSINSDDVELLKKHIDESLKRTEGTEYFETAKIRRDDLLRRLNHIAEQQDLFADNVQRRIDRFKTYETELESIKTNAVSVKYWRAKPVSDEATDVFTFVVEISNDSAEETQIVEKKHFLPKEVKPEHIVELQGFEIGYDALKGQSYLTKSEKLEPKETKRYTFGIYDVWDISQVEIDNLKARASNTYKLLENTEYISSADYLMGNIKQKLDAVEESQSQEKGIEESVSSYRDNVKSLASTKEDVETLEELLEAVRENLERSKVKNVLEKLSSLRSIKDIAQTLFKKPELNTAWKIILGIIIFVGLLTLVHFTIWGRRSRAAKIKDASESKEEE